MPATTAARARTRMSPDHRRAALLDAAMEYFDHHGIDVPLETLARAAGISPPLMRRYFGTRDGLLLALFRARLPRVTSIFTTPQVAVRDQLIAYLDWIEQRPWAHHLWVAAVHDPSRDPGLREAILTARAVLIERAAGQPLGTHDHNLRARAEAFVAAFEGAISRWLAAGAGDREMLLDDLMDIARRLEIAGRLEPGD